MMAELSHGLLGEVAELLLGAVLQRGPDDLDVGRQCRQRKVRHARQQLAASKITRSAEQHDDVGLDDIQANTRACTEGRISNGLSAVICHATMLPPPALQQQGATPDLMSAWAMCCRTRPTALCSSARWTCCCVRRPLVQPALTPSNSGGRGPTPQCPPISRSINLLPPYATPGCS